MKLSRAEILELSVAERIEVICELWDSLEGAVGELPLTEADKQELDSRLEDYERDPQVFRTWEQLRDRLDDGK